MPFSSFLIPGLVALSELGLFFWFYLAPQHISWIIVLLFLVSFGAILKLNRFPLIQKVRSASFWNFFFPIFFLTSSVLIFGLFVEQMNQFILLSLLSAFLSFLYLRYVSIYFRQPLLYEEGSLANLSLLLATLTIFFLSADLFALLLLLNVNVIPVIFLWVFVTLLTSFQIFWISHVPFRRAWMYSLISAVIFAELFWAFRYLPLRYPVVGSTLAVMFFLIHQMCLLWIKEQWEFKRVRKYIIMGVVILFIILSTTDWI